MRQVSGGGISVDFVTGDGHCVERAARAELESLTGRLLSCDEAPAGEDEERFQLLREFIDGSDFPALRASDPRLDGSTAARCRVHRDGAGRSRLSILTDENKE